MTFTPTATVADTPPEADAAAVSSARKTIFFGADQPFVTDGGGVIAPLTIAFETYGELNAERSNAILLCHALTGDQYAASMHPLTGKPGWWDVLVGPGLPFDTDRYFVICSNVVGGCMGTTGPASLNPATGRAYGLDFPVVTIRDMVRAQAMMIDHLGIETLFCVAGGSMGGMQALQWAASYPERVFAAMPIATAARHSSQNIAFHEVGRQAVMADPDWRSGRYLDEGVRPEKGLAVARMAAHITYLSEQALQRKFGRKLQDRGAPTFSFDADFQIESYLRHQGSPSSSASTPIPISSSREPAIISISPRITAGRWRAPSRIARRGFAWSPSPRTGSIRRRLARHRACAERWRRLGLFRRDRQRQGA